MNIDDIVICSYDLEKATINACGIYEFHDVYFQMTRRNLQINSTAKNCMYPAIRDRAFLQVTEYHHEKGLLCAIVYHPEGVSYPRAWIWPTKYLVPVPDSVFKKAQLLEINRWSNYPNT